MIFDQPIYVREGELIQVGAKTRRGFASFYDCTTVDVANEVAGAMNLVWQALVYGTPDPALKTAFLDLYGGEGYCGDDVNEIVGKFYDAGILPEILGFQATIN